MRSAILRLKEHIPFQNKTSFHEGKIVFKVHYRDINIKKLSLKPNMKPLKTTVTCTNHPPLHTPIHPGHHPLVPTGGTESGKVTLQQNIKTVSQSGTAVDHNAVSSPENIDSFASQRIDESQIGACGNMEVGAQSRDPPSMPAETITSPPLPQENRKSFASEVKIHNIHEETQRVNFDREKVRATQRPEETNEEQNKEIASVIYVQIQNKPVTLPKSEIERVKSAKMEDVYYDCQSDFEEEEEKPLYEFDLQTLYDFDFSWKSFMPLRKGLICHGFSELSKLKLDMAEFRNAQMANQINSALEKRITGFGFEIMLWNKVREDLP
jgi:hypothetical protein